MPIDLIVPEVGESITEVQIGKWLKREGEAVAKDEPLVEIETDKVTLELPAPAAGVIRRITHPQGTDAKVGDVIGAMEEGAAPAAVKPSPTKRGAEGPDQAAPKKPADTTGTHSAAAATVMPAAQRLLDENNLKPGQVAATGPGGRLLKEDVQNHLNNGGATSSLPGPSPERIEAQDHAQTGSRREQAVPMTPLRKRIAANLVQAQQTAALLTTFNEIDMTATMDTRARYKDAFEKKYGIKLGFMSFFVKAAVDALGQFPAVNAEVRDTTIVYKDYFDIGIAIGGGKGLVVPVLRNAETMSFADIEKKIADYAAAAKANKIQLEDLTGGTFTITNGGVYGSLLSTPIVNPPQSGVLGMHGIVRRPIAVDPGTPGERIEIRPMMYVALTYDHRVVDGREAVTFLRRIKDGIEDPARLLMEV